MAWCTLLKCIVFESSIRTVWRASPICFNKKVWICTSMTLSVVRSSTILTLLITFVAYHCGFVCVVSFPANINTGLWYRVTHQWEGAFLLTFSTILVIEQACGTHTYLCIRVFGHSYLTVTFTCWLCKYSWKFANCTIIGVCTHTFKTGFITLGA